MVLQWFRLWWVMVGVVCITSAAPHDGAIVRLGARLFSEERFAQFFHAGSRGDVNAQLRTADPALRAVGERLSGSADSARKAISCRSCHFTGSDAPDDAGTKDRFAPFADFSQRSSVTERGDGRATTPRNSPSLIDALTGSALLHFDAEFATPESLVRETFIGRSYGWLPRERSDAIRHVAKVLREDNGTRAADEQGRTDGIMRSKTVAPTLPYATLLRGTAPEIPETSRLPEGLRVDPAMASDDELLEVAAKCVVAFLRTLRFSRDDVGLNNGSPYDAFLAANRIPRAPGAGQSLPEYGRRIGEQVATLREPRFVDDPARRLRTHDQPFRFGELELEGMRIFFRGAISPRQRSGAGNCAECHVPPHFADFKFHNSGVAEDEYDTIHGAGAFLRLNVPRLAARDADYDRWLPPTPQHPAASGPFLFPAAKDTRIYTDLGVWNVYANPDLPPVQAALERVLNPSGRLTRDEVLAQTIGRFKTSGLRNLGHTGPYFHTGRAASLEDTIGFYERMSSLAHGRVMRNAPPEFHAMRLGAEDVAPLVAFLRALNEDFREGDQVPNAF